MRIEALSRVEQRPPRRHGRRGLPRGQRAASAAPASKARCVRALPMRTYRQEGRVGAGSPSEFARQPCHSRDRAFESLILHYPLALPTVGGAPVAIPCNASPSAAGTTECRRGWTPRHCGPDRKAGAPPGWRGASELTGQATSGCYATRGDSTARRVRSWVYTRLAACYPSFSLPDTGPPVSQKWLRGSGWLRGCGLRHFREGTARILNTDSTRTHVDLPGLSRLLPSSSRRYRSLRYYSRHHRSRRYRSRRYRSRHDCRRPRNSAHPPLSAPPSRTTFAFLVLLYLRA